MGYLTGRLGPRPLLLAGGLLVGLGLALSLLIGAHADYSTAILPSVIVLSMGVACAAAPLTNAVLGAVDARHTGAASGLNSAVARIGGVIAVALLGPVLSRHGPSLLAALHAAALAGVPVAVAGAACALALSRRTNTAPAAAR